MRLVRVGLACSLAIASGYTSGAAPASQERSAVEAAKAGWSIAALDELAAYVQSQKSTGFLIIQDRRVIYEHNWPLPPEAANFAANFTHGTDARGALQEDVASAQKSFIAILAGVAIDKGLLDISKPASAYIGTGWSKAAPEQEKLITVRHLLEMNSGLTELLAHEAPAGTRFFYNTPAYAFMKPVLEKASGQTLDDLTRAWLTKPAGMTDTLWRRRPAAFAEVGNPTGLYTTPSDMAKVGQLVLDKGKAADGTRVISEAQLAALFERSPTNPSLRPSVVAQRLSLRVAPCRRPHGDGVDPGRPGRPRCGSWRAGPQDLCRAQSQADCRPDRPDSSRPRLQPATLAAVDEGGSEGRH